MAKAVRKTQPSEPAAETPDWVSHQFEFRHNFIVSVKAVKDGEKVPDVDTWEEVQQEIRELLKKRFPSGMFTPSGGYILIDGKACYPHDFDYETMNRKPGTKPPLYTLTQEEQKEIGLTERIDRERRNFERTGNSLAMNPTHLLTSHETDRLKKLRNGTGKVVVRRRDAPREETVEVPAEVEWTEDDANDEALAERETEKLLKRLPSKPVVKRTPVRLKRRT